MRLSEVATELTKLPSMVGPEPWVGVFLFCAVAPVLGIRLTPYLVRTPSSRAEKYLGALSIGVLVTALFADLLYRILSFRFGASFWTSLLVGTTVLTGALLAHNRYLRQNQVTSTNSTSWSLLSATTGSRIAIAIFGVVTALALFSPIFGNDQFEYFAVAEDWSVNGTEGYPPTAGSLDGRVVAPSSHPTGYHTLIAALGLSEIPVMFHLVYLTIVISTVLYVSGFVREPGLYILAFCGTPVFLSQLMSRSIDPIWLSGVQVGTLSLIALGGKGIQPQTPRFTWLVSSLSAYAIAIALTIGFHSAGLLALALMLGGLFVVVRPPMFQIGMTACGASVALLISNQYIVNMVRYGFPVQDSAAVFTLSNLEFDDDLAIRRGISSAVDKLLTGALRGFTDYFSFGLVAWLALLSTLIIVLRSKRSGQDQFTTVHLVIFIFAILFFTVSASLEFDLAIKNARYWQIFLPSMAAVIGSVTWRD